MFVAYLVPQQDLHLVAEDGLGLLALGSTRERAIEKLKKQFYEAWTIFPEGHQLYCAETYEQELGERDAAWEDIVAENNESDKLFVIEEKDED